jgi:hypothetical protein
MSSSNRSDIPDSHAAMVVVLWIVASAVVVAGTLAVIAYFAPGRPDALFGGRWFPQMVSGTRSLSSAMPAPDQVGTSILRSVVATVVVTFVAVIGGIGVWDAWQSRKRRSSDAPQRGDAPATKAETRDVNEAQSATPPTDAETLHSPDVARARARRSHRAGAEPDTWQGGTA